MPTVSLLCGLADARLMLMAALGRDDNVNDASLLDDTARLLRDGLQVTREEAKRTSIQEWTSVVAESEKWVAAWIADLNRFHALQQQQQQQQQIIGVTPLKNDLQQQVATAAQGYSQLNDVFFCQSATANMPPALMERQLALQKPMMIAWQQRSVREARAIERWKKVEKSLSHERGTWPAIEVRKL